MKKKAHEKIKTIAGHYGFEHQAKKTVEELCELNSAIFSFLISMPELYENLSEQEIRHTFLFKNLLEEMEDVKIMINQLEYLLDAKEEMKDIRDAKLYRQIERIEGEKEEHGES